MCQEAFQILKQTLLTNPIVRNPDFSKIFILQTDASEVGVGAILSQLDDNDQDHPIRYFSRKLLPREQKYVTVEKECLAVKLGIQHFEVYLMGKPFRIQMDHRALQWLNNFKEKNSRLTRWSLALQPFTFTIEHKKGNDNANDRHPIKDARVHVPAFRRGKCDRAGIKTDIECFACSKALVCCGHNVLCLNLVFTCSLSDNYVACTTQGVR